MLLAQRGARGSDAVRATLGLNRSPGLVGVDRAWLGLRGPHNLYEARTMPELAGILALTGSGGGPNAARTVPTRFGESGSGASALARLRRLRRFLA